MTSIGRATTFPERVSALSIPNTSSSATALATASTISPGPNSAILALLGLALVLGSDWIVLLMVPALLPADRLACHRAGPKVRNRALEYGLVSMSNEATATARTSALVSCVTSPVGRNCVGDRGNHRAMRDDRQTGIADQGSL